MKFATVSLAFLGLPSSLAALIPLDASPTRPEAALVVPGASVLSPTATSTPQPDFDFQPKQDIKRALIPTVPPIDSSSSSSGSSSGSSSTAKGSKQSTQKTMTTTTSSHKSSTTTKSKITELLGSFTAGGAVFRVTSESGLVAIDGKTLSVGGPDALIAGDVVTDSPNGLLVDGSSISLAPPSSSSIPAMSSSAAGGGSSKAASKSSAGAAAPSSSSTSSSPNAAPTPTAARGANAVALIGAVVGAMIL